jgi:hypothetical protein
MKRANMLKYCQLVLQKVDFDRKLFWKEYKKSLRRYLNEHEGNELKVWVKSRYYPEKI